MPFGNAKVQRPGRKLLIAAMAATFGMGLSGCNDDNNSSNTGGNTDNVNTPKGTVQGAVIDTNGNPLAGARVFIDGREQVTGVSGQYKFENVAVVKASTPNNNTPAANSPIPITIIAPAGYLGVNLQIGPQAQITSSDNGGLGGGQTNPQLVFVDGFNAGAGTVVLPQLNTTVRGVLRDFTTGVPVVNRVLTADFDTVELDQSNGPVAGVTVSYQASGAIVAQTTGADGSFTFTGLAADSVYNLAGSGLDLGVLQGGPEVENGNFVTFTTNPESNNTVDLNDVSARIAVSNDVLAPYLEEIAGRVSGRGDARPTLESRINGVGVSGALQFVFSEPLSGPLNTSTVRVFVRSEAAVDLRALAAADYTVSFTGRTLTIQTTAALAPGDLVTVSILPEAVRDLADLVDPAALPNALIKVPTNATNPGVTLPQLAADDATPLPATVTDGTYQIAVRIFKPTDTNADAPGVDPAAGLGQIKVAVNPTDFNFVSTSTLIDTIINAGTINSAIVDTAGGGTADNYVQPYGWQGSIEQLNGTGAAPQRLALQRLNDALNDGLVNNNPLSVLQNAPGFVHPNTALVKFTVPANAARVAIGLSRPGRASALDVGFFPLAPATIESVVTPKALGDGINRYYINPNGATTVSVVIAGGRHTVGPIDTTFPDIVLPGDTVILDSIAAAGTTGASSTIALVDHVAPTTEVQLTMDAIAGGGSVLGPAGGGAVVPPNGTLTAGTPILPITPQLLDVTDTTNTTAAALDAASQLALVRGAGYTNDNLRAANELGGLSRSTIVNDPATPVNETLSADAQLTALEGLFSAKSVAHNAAGTAAAAVSSARRIGFAFTEPVTLVAGATVAGTGFTLTNLTAEQRTDEDGKAVYLVLADVNDIFAFEAAGRTGAVVDFTSAITDAAGNAPTAATNAKVALRDYLPPLMLRAFADNANFVFDFHEAVSFNPADAGGASEITIIGAGGTCGNVTVDLNQAAQLTVGAATLAANFNGVANARVVVPVTAVVAQNTGLQIGDCFDSATAYGEGAIYTKASLGTATTLTDSLIAVRPTHFGVDYSKVADRAGNNGLAVGGVPQSNRWVNWEGLTPNLGIDRPIFAGANIVGDFNVVDAFNPAACTGNVAGSTSINCELQFTHPVLITGGDFDGDDADTGDGMVSNQELIDFFNVKFALVDGNDALIGANLITGVTLIDASGVTINAGGATLTPAQANSAPRIILSFGTVPPLVGAPPGAATVTRVWLAPFPAGQSGGRTLTSALTGVGVPDNGTEFLNGQRVIQGLIRRDDGDATVGNNGFVPAELRPSITQP